MIALESDVPTNARSQAREVCGAQPSPGFYRGIAEATWIAEPTSTVRDSFAPRLSLYVVSDQTRAALRRRNQQIDRLHRC